MATQLKDVLTAARNRHQAFHRSRIPDVVVASHLADVQRILITRGADLDSNRVAVQCNIAFATSPGNAPGQVGAGTAGGLPGKLVGQSIDFLGQDTGPSIELDVDTAQVLVAETVVLSATALTVRLVGVAWVVNQFANQIAVVVAGTGYAQKRSILSNTVDTLTISTGADGQQWQTIPDATSMIRVVATKLVADELVSFVTELPPTQQRSGYLVRLDATGKPFLDIANPIVINIDAGIPLPAYERVLGGAVRFKTSTPLSPTTGPLTIRPYRDRYLWGPTYTIWLENEQVFLAGQLQDWASVVAIDLRLVPVPADFVARTDYFVLPDLARPVLIAEAAWFMAMRCQGIVDAPPVPLDVFDKERERANEHFLQAIGATPRAQASYVREVW